MQPAKPETERGEQAINCSCGSHRKPNKAKIFSGFTFFLYNPLFPPVLSLVLNAPSHFLWTRRLSFRVLNWFLMIGFHLSQLVLILTFKITFYFLLLFYSFDISNQVFLYQWSRFDLVLFHILKFSTSPIYKFYYFLIQSTVHQPIS